MVVRVVLGTAISLALTPALASSTEQGELLCGVAVSDSIAAADVHRYTVGGVAGEVVHVTVGRGTLLFPVWRLAEVPECASFQAGERDCRLPAGGTYVLEVRDNDALSTGTYSVHLQRLTAGRRCAQPLPCDVPIEAGVEVAADTDLYGFFAAEGEQVHVTAARGTLIVPEWRLVDAAGAPVAGCSGFAPGERDCGPLAAAGSPYAVEVEDNDLRSTGSYSLHLQRLTAPRRCGPALPCDVAPRARTPRQSRASTIVESRADSDLLGFAAADGERVHVTVGRGTLTFPEWRLLDAAGVPVAGCGLFAQGGRDCGPLAAAASPYAVEVEDDDRLSTGTYGVHLQRLTHPRRCPTGTLACGATVAGAIETPGDTDLFALAFDVDGHTLHVDAARGSLVSPQWRVVNGEGVAVCPFRPAENFCGPLPASSHRYAVEVEDNDLLNVGTYTLTVDVGTAPCPEPAGPDVDVDALPVQP
jgi:hypothetical protein